MTKHLLSGRRELRKKSEADESRENDWLEFVVTVGLIVTAVVNYFRWSSEGSLKAFLDDVYTRVTQAIDWHYHWWRLPTVPALAVLLAARDLYRRKNLYNTGPPPTTNR